MLVFDASGSMGSIKNGLPKIDVAREAATALTGQAVTDSTASMAADMAVARATPLSMNEYKVQMARAAVKRALLRAVNKLDESLV